MSWFVPYPDDLPPRYNGSGTPCDMLIGPCSCGATHLSPSPGLVKAAQSGVRPAKRDYNAGFCGASISEVIVKLQQIRHEHGDLVVFVSTDNGNASKLYEVAYRDEPGRGKYVEIA